MSTCIIRKNDKIEDSMEGRTEMIKILIVEDDPNIAKLMEATVAIGGYDSEVCSNGSEAFEKIERTNYDLILLDVMLPDMSGFEIMKKRTNTESPVIFITAKQELTDKVRGLSGKLMELITVGEAKLEWQQEDMAKLFAEIGTSLKVVADKHNISLYCESEEGMLWVDRELFKSLLYNLVDNAMKASQEGGLIQVLGQFEEELFCIQVIDEGIGIPKEEIDKITQAFYMVDKVRGRANGGAGLGLALCAEIVSTHRGVMRFESQLGEGTCVFIRMKGGKAIA